MPRNCGSAPWGLAFCVMIRAVATSCGVDRTDATKPAHVAASRWQRMSSREYPALSTKAFFAESYLGADEGAACGAGGR